MKVLIDCHTPFMLAHGGMQIQVVKTLAALNEVGIKAEMLRWWDENQTCDVIHHFGLVPNLMIDLAHRRKVKVVMTLLLSQQCNRSDARIRLNAVVRQISSRLPLSKLFGTTPIWQLCQNCDHIVVGLQAEKRIATKVFGVALERVSVLPIGQSESFLQQEPSKRDGDHLVTVGTIAPVKRSVELARLAKKAHIPLLFVGRPFDSEDEYWRRFEKEIDGKWVRHHGHTVSEQELANLLRQARGFVLMSQYENWSMAADEAVSCGLPLLLADLPWARERFGDQASYFSVKHPDTNVAALQRFYASAPSLTVPSIAKVGWRDVADHLVRIYHSLVA